MAREIKALLDEEIAAYAARNPRSQAMFARAKQSLPGGNTRTGVHIDPFPLYADRGEGAYLYDIDGHRLTDFVNNNTALPLGHAHPAIVAALQEQIARGTGFSRPLALEVEMAEALRARMPALEKVRFCSSGTEAVLNALRVARAHTGRTKVAKFEGAYHGIDDSALVSYLPPLGPELGPANKPQGVASSAGLMAHTLYDVVVLPFNDAVTCAEIIGDNAQDLAAVIVDPLSTAAGLALPEPGFLSDLRDATTRAGALLIFDEIVSFRFGPGGTHTAYQVRPDLICLGKVIAGGTPGAAFGGRADAMDLYDPADGAADPTVRDLQRQSHRPSRRPADAPSADSRGVRANGKGWRGGRLKGWRLRLARLVSPCRWSWPGPYSGCISSNSRRATSAKQRRTTRRCTAGCSSLCSTRGYTRGRAATYHWRPRLTTSTRWFRGCAR